MHSGRLCHVTGVVFFHFIRREVSLLLGFFKIDRFLEGILLAVEAKNGLSVVELHFILHEPNLPIVYLCFGLLESRRLVILVFGSGCKNGLM